MTLKLDLHCHFQAFLVKRSSWSTFNSSECSFEETAGCDIRTIASLPKTNPKLEVKPKHLHHGKTSLRCWLWFDPSLCETLSVQTMLFILWWKVTVSELHVGNSYKLGLQHTKQEVQLLVLFSAFFIQSGIRNPEICSYRGIRPCRNSQMKLSSCRSLTRNIRTLFRSKQPAPELSSQVSCSKSVLLYLL